MNEEKEPRRLQTMNYKQKYAIIRQMEQGKSFAKIAKDYNISKSTVHYISKDKERIKAICEDTPEKSHQKRATSLKFPELEASVLRFVQKSRDRDEKITGNIIKAVALQTAAEMNIAPFTASNGWLNSFTKRNGIIFGGGRKSSSANYIDYDPEYDDNTDQLQQEPKYKIEEVNEEEEPINWRNWCRLCSNTDTIAEFEPFLYDVLTQIIQVNYIEGVKICKNCHSSISSISKLIHRTKITEKMFEELEEQEKRSCLTNDQTFAIRHQYIDIADSSENVTVKMENVDEEEVLQDGLAYDENKFLVDCEVEENSYEEEEDEVDEEDDDVQEESSTDTWFDDSYIESKPSSSYAKVKHRKTRKKSPPKSTIIPFDESMYDFTCHVCNENFDRMCFLSNHTRKEHNCLPQVACTCGRYLATWDSLMNHKRKHENTGEWACDICGSRKLTKSGLKLHMQFKHLRVKPHHLCTVCGKEFKEASGLKQHERSHLPDEEKLIHECHQCGKRFSQKPTLRAHIRLHTSEKTIICHICSKAFTTQNYLKVHLATHEIENIGCSYCDGIFKNKSSLQSHVRKMHKPGNAAFPCNECGKTFPNRNFLKRHMASHSGARNYKCTFSGCEQTYKYEKDLRNHYNIHTNIKKKCLYCEREFIDNSNMRKHVLRNHPVEVAEFEAKFGKRRRLKNLLIEHEMITTQGSSSFAQHLSSSFQNSLGTSSINENY